MTGRRITLPEYLEIWRQMLGFPFCFNLKGLGNLSSWRTFQDSWTWCCVCAGTKQEAYVYFVKGDLQPEGSGGW